MSSDMEIKGLGELSAALDKLADGVADFRRSEGALHDGISDAVRQHFDTRGSGRWAPPAMRGGFAPFVRPGFTPMRDTDTLFGSLTSRTGAGALWDVRAQEINYGSRVPYARAQHYGVRSRNLPARALVPDADELGRVVFTAVRRDAADFARGPGFEVREG